MKGLADSMAGRIAFVDLYPMTVGEITGNAQADHWLRGWLTSDTPPAAEGPADPPDAWHRVIWRGGYPGLLDLPDRLVPAYFEGYERTYIERDIRRINAVGDLQTFGRFCRLLAGLSGCEVNESQLGRDLGIDRRTAHAWRSVLAHSYQWIEASSYSRNATRRVAGKSKGYLTDTGLMCFQQGLASADAVASHPLLGQLVETWAVNEIGRILQAFPVRPGMHHFRTRGGAEVDLVLELDGRLHPVEVKHASRPAPRDLLGFRSLREAHSSVRIGPGLVICGIERPQWIADDILAVPWWRL